MPRRRFWTDIHASCRTDQWATPQTFFDDLHAEFGFTRDARASASNAKCGRYFTAKHDGLSQDWGREILWVNPPYGWNITGRWVEKAYHASGAGATVVIPVPARTDTRWWHDRALKGAVRFVRGRLRFGDGLAPAPFPSAILIFRPPRRRAPRVGVEI
jgi:phage N-6-adenine-methyltransferase